tara:strand:- start:959 stop:1267 length:309 start_codon:yes stop_codon:yes gene_type:complete
MTGKEQKPKYNYVINEIDRVETDVDDEIEEIVKDTIKEIKPKKVKKVKNKRIDKYKDWREHWLGRNTPIKSCYNNCQGLRRHDYINCSENCMLKDTFGRKYK